MYWLNNKSYSNILNSLFFLFLLSLFAQFKVLDFYGLIIQISEIIFIILFPLFIIFNYKKIYRNFSNFDFCLFLWTILNLSVFFLQDTESRNLSGILFSAYCYSIYIFGKNYIKDNQNFFLKSLLIIILVNSIFSIIGWILVQLNYETILVKYYVDYPLSFLKEYRSTGFTPSPNFLFFHLVLAYFLIYKKNIGNLYTNQKKILINSIIFLGILFTFSKSILVFLFLFFYILLDKKWDDFNFKKFFFYAFLLFLIYNFFTNFIIITTKNTPLNKIKNSINTNNLYVDKNNSEPLLENNHIKIYPSTYLILKKKSFDLIKDNYLYGIGNNNFKYFLKDKYESLVNAKPHSTINSIILSTGLLGLFLWIALFILICKQISNIRNLNSLYIIFFILFESINMDIHYFKLVWLILPYILLEKKV